MTTVSRKQFFNFVKELDKEDFDDPETWVPSTQYYLKLWDRHQGQSWFWSWNWGAFFFSFLWFSYRKMFLFAFTYYVFQFFCAEVYPALFRGIHILPSVSEMENIAKYFGSASKPEVIVSLILVFCNFVIPAVIANPLYFYYAKSRQGGTSNGAAIAFMIIIVAFALMVKFELAEPLKQFVGL